MEKIRQFTVYAEYLVCTLQKRESSAFRLIINKLASLADQSVITGHGYGDDYLFVPHNPVKKQAIEDLLTGENLIWEIVDSLPNHIQLHK